MKNSELISRNLIHDSGKKHVSGLAEYTDDITEPLNILYGAIGWSKKAHAKIKKIDLEEVKNSEGVEAVVTHLDIPGRNDVGPVFGGDPIFPRTKVEYYGQPLFAVAASSVELARKAVLRAKVHYKELKPIISIDEALNHPNWDMGKKITIDSATMMNKGLEVIEAYWLFGFDLNSINIVVHPQSIIHSMIEMNDGAVKAQMGVPDMKVPIQYALTYPNHISAPWERLDFFSCGDLTFQPPDFKRFPSIPLAFRALELLGTAGTALNLANDTTVELFLKDKIAFTDIPRINEVILEEHPWVEDPTLDDIKSLSTWVKYKINNL